MSNIVSYMPFPMKAGGDSPCFYPIVNGQYFKSSTMESFFGDCFRYGLLRYVPVNAVRAIFEHDESSLLLSASENESLYKVSHVNFLHALLLKRQEMQMLTNAIFDEFHSTTFYFDYMLMV